MMNRSNVKEKKSAEIKFCRHYWHIEEADGPVSRGICKICGEKKEFQNSWIASSYMGKDAAFLTCPTCLKMRRKRKRVPDRV
ncbi:hypothetical protein ES703_35503 [subsurface metagenome]|nr:hypothetical protein [Dehalococcoidia bacterium]